MAAKDADLARDFSPDFVYLAAGTPVAAFEASVLATPPQSAGPREEELFLARDVLAIAAFEIEVVTTPHGSSSASLPTIQHAQKSQFVSTEALDILLQPFLSADGSHIVSGADVITLILKAPDSTIYNPTAVWDPVVSMWVAQLGVIDFQEGEWLLYGVSDIVNSIPQFLSLWWGDYMDDIPETRQAALGRWKIDGFVLRLYEEDGLTAFKEFDLKDDVGDPSNTKVFDKDPV